MERANLYYNNYVDIDLYLKDKRDSIGGLEHDNYAVLVVVYAAPRKVFLLFLFDGYGGREVELLLQPNKQHVLPTSR